MTFITTFFNNEEYYMANFIAWYKKLWGANKFIFFIGKCEVNETNFECDGINFLVTENNNIITYEYKSGINEPNKWTSLKGVFNKIISINHMLYPSMWLDCDELIYSKDIDKVLKDTYIKTHYYEYIPIIPFDLNSNSKWSVCSYYYREQALGNMKDVQHQNCAYRSLNPLEQGGHMGGGNDYCNTSLKYDDYTNICFHVGVHSKDHYQKSKHWLQTHPNGIEINDDVRDSGILSNIFDDFHINCTFDTFTLNLYDTYLK